MPCRVKRAMSMMYDNDEKQTSLLDQKPLQLQSRHSETNLLRIDRQKTFEQQNTLDNTGELLAQVVFALNGFNADEQGGAPSMTGGTDLFSDESILEDEWSVVTTPVEQPNQKKQRSRAKSLFTQISKTSGSSVETPQLTWSGNNNDIQDYVNSQVKGDKKAPKDAHKDTSAGANGVVISIDKDKEADSDTNRRKSVFNVISNVFKRRNTLMQSEQPKPPIQVKGKSPPFELMTPIKMNVPRMSIFSGDFRRRPSILSNQSVSSEQVLENTTIADLIRAIESTHTKNLLGPPKSSEMLGRRRMSMVPQMTRRSSVSFSSPLEAPPSPVTNPISQRKPVLPRNRHLMVRPNPNRFSVTPVGDNAASVVTSPIIQRRMRRFSAIPATTVMPPRKQSLSSSLHATPLALRRAQFKQTISPLAMPPTPETPSDTTHSIRTNKLSKK